MPDGSDVVRGRHEAAAKDPAVWLKYGEQVYALVYQGHLPTDMATLLAAHDRLEAEVERLGNALRQAQLDTREVYFGPRTGERP